MAYADELKAPQPLDQLTWHEKFHYRGVCLDSDDLFKYRLTDLSMRDLLMTKGLPLEVFKKPLLQGFFFAQKWLQAALRPGGV